MTVPSPAPPRLSACLLLALSLTPGCGGEENAAAASRDAAGARETLPTDTAPGVATALGSGDASLSPEAIEEGRQDPSWRQYLPEADGAGSGGGADTIPESWDDITPGAVNGESVHLPLHGDVAGPSVLAVQILLDRSLYRPGVIDGRWGKNTEKAVYWLQSSRGIAASGRVGEPTLRQLGELAGRPERLVVEREMTEADVSGPFVDIPEDVYEKAELDCLCYESRREQLAERFHTTPALLEQLNPGTDLDAVAVGDRLQVPNVERFTAEGTEPAGQGRGRATSGDVAEIVISDGGHWVHAVDDAGDILYHFPSTLGSDYAPSPEGDYSIDSIHQDPSWHYKPDLLTGVDPSRPDAMLPPGPNNAVGVVWMQLSKPHYGIHGTSAPETIGYVTSHGCVRLTNWDAEFLSHQVEGGVPVRFVDDSGRG